MKETAVRGATVALAAAALVFVPLQAQTSPEWAQKGIKAFGEGRIDLARMYFQRAMEDAVLKGSEEWLVKAALNLTDLELEALRLDEAERLLNHSPRPDAAFLRALLAWKRAQLAFLQKRESAAVDLCDSALRLLPADHGARIVVEADRLRFLLPAADAETWRPEFEGFKQRLPQGSRRMAVPLDAEARMRAGDFSGAAALWKEAADDYRARGRLSQVAASMNKLALCRLALGDREGALEENEKAVGIYRQLGLALPALRAQALRLVAAGQEGQLAKSRREMDLVGHGRTGFDLQDVLDDYAQILSVRPVDR